MADPDSLVSVVVPTYNRAYCVGASIASALAQTHRNLEVIVVDDGSSDNTEAVIAEIMRQDDRVRFVQQPNRGVATARNTGFSNCMGDFIALLDSDDLWLPWKLELQLACMDQYPDLGMIWTDMEAVDAQGRVASPAYLREMYSAWNHFSVDTLFAKHVPLREIAPAFASEYGSKVFHHGEIFSEMLMGNLVHTPTVLIRRERFLDVNGFDESLCPAGEDYDFHLRICRAGAVGFIDLPTIKYRVGMADALSRHALSLSTNFLKVVNRTLAEDRAQLRLPQEKIDWVCADANAWVAEVLLDHDDGPGARRHVMNALRFRPFHPKTAKLAALALMPRPLRHGVRRLWAGAKGTAGRSAQQGRTF
jgi:glycosyltransferase involved in cell wall biosynthesis